MKLNGFKKLEVNMHKSNCKCHKCFDKLKVKSKFEGFLK